MANMKSLAKDTAIYGLSSIVGRFLSYLLTPLYTFVLDAKSGGLGVVTNVYAYTALILVILTFGMETTYFRFVNKEKENPDTVFSSTIGVVTFLSLIFVGTVFAFIDPIGEMMGYPDHHEYITMMAVTVAIDSVMAIPFCFLRYKGKAKKFAILKFLNIVTGVLLNVTCFVLLGFTDVVYVFIINLFCSSIMTLFFIPEFFAIKWKVDFALIRRMFNYSWPILILGIAGILNQAFDKMVFPWTYTYTGLHTMTEAKNQLGIYGACVKVAMIMAILTQTFRYAYEPIVFAKSKDRDSKEYYAVAMKYFIIFMLLAFLCVMGYIDILKRIIAKDYQEGLAVIPIVMAAEIMMGIYFNLSFWYKLIDKTIWGAWFSFAGCSVLIAVNILFVPKFGYMACAWGGFAGYGTAMVLSYIIGQMKNPIKYDMAGIGVYVLITCLFFGAMQVVATYVDNVILRLLINTGLIILFLAHIIYHDIPLQSLPVIGKKFKK
ncbi:MAG: lipopolysaccharide biosynthesis protein [Bacteroidaceae bacterium]|nr:lipopolysaccharide biosynthesis protein [Bacteroidaceae bacterium]